MFFFDITVYISIQSLKDKFIHRRIKIPHNFF